MKDTEHRLAKQYSELRLFRSIREADQAVKAWEAQALRAPTYWAELTGFAIGVAVVVAAILVGLSRWLPVPKSMYGGLIGGITAGSSIGAMTWFWRRRCKRFLRERLVSIGTPICITCGYDLRGQTENRCPECGTRFDVDLIYSNPEHLA